MNKICHSLLKISQQVAEAIAHQKPIVALESTIISHGMPYPQNKQCALLIERKIRQQGAVPATVAILDGKIHVGLEETQIEKLAQTGTAVRKVSRRDLPFIIANKGIGATTVSATMIGAHAAGIDLFVTGGIGGVHRGFQNTMDVSADLDELARTPVTVVSAGVKSILDIPRTLEYLETKGVPVITYQSKYFPAFFSASSGILSPFTIHSQTEAAQIIYAHQQLNLENGMLIAVPNNNPAEGQEIEKAISQSIKQSQEQKISGAKITPFLLKRVNELTSGRSLSSNVSLVQNNAQVGAKIAVELSRLKKERRELANKKFSLSSGQGEQNKQTPTDRNEKVKPTRNPEVKGRLIAIGGCAIDYQLSPKEGAFELYKSCIGKTRKSLGGIARNIVDCSSKLGINTVLISAIGNDTESQMIRGFCQKQGIKLIEIDQPGRETELSSGKYYAILDHNNNELLGISQMNINEILTFDRIYEKFFKIQQSLPAGSPDRITSQDIIVVDSNIPEIELKKIVQFCSEQFGCLIVYEAKGKKSRKVVTSGAFPYIDILKMNLLQKKQIEEALAEGKGCKKQQIYDWLWTYAGQKCSGQSAIRAIITKGSEDVEVVYKSKKSRHLVVPKPDRVEKTTGAGDTFTATFCSMLLVGKEEDEALIYARAASKINIESPINESVISDHIRMDELDRLVEHLKSTHEYI